MTASLKRLTFIGLADIYNLPYGQAGAMLPFGSISKADLGFEENVLTQQNFGRSGGRLNSHARLEDVTLSLTFQELNLDNLALLTRGTKRTENSGDVEDEAHTVTIGGFARLQGISQSAIVVKNTAGDVTYVKGVHWRAGGSGIQWLGGSTLTIPALTNGAEVEVSYSKAGIDVVEALTGTALELAVHFDGLNEAEGNQNVAVDVYRWKPNLVQNLSMIGTEFASAEVSGSVLVDPAQTGEGRSKFFRWIHPKAA